ncbi:MAG TPA: 16S rRNA (cytidine(1402)-2'-O)-methyltransferase [Candidatus Kaiserbacteria bacterium]|nr:16S rRNA (cytidine(1402)-2'-O)-methyltransferase [Candidatus Kaiserbacteria bacterium]
MNKLSIVATPIGNLGDITLRALDILRETDVIACEDTRVTAKLLAHYNIKKPLVIFHARNARVAGVRILELLSEGKNIALVTDAGTPGVSDPGSALVGLVRSKLPDIVIEAIPGASALVTALSVSGVQISEFTFLGFLPHKKGRQTLFAEIAEASRAYVFYESPHRIEKALASLVDVLSEERRIVVARELTKIYESVVSGSALEVSSYFSSHPDEVRGEFVVIVAP